MTLSAHAQSKTGFADLRQQFHSLICDTPTQSGEIGKLPASSSEQLKRETLHLKKSSKKRDANLAA